MASRKKILVVEDEPAMREIVAQKLVDHDYTVKQAEDGKKAVEMIMEEKPDLILLDLMIPEIDGFQLLKTVRENPDKTISQIPVIVLTNIWNKDDIKRVTALKVEDYLVKTYNTTDDILYKITEFFKKQK